MAAVVQFVDSIVENPGVRLDLNSQSGGLMIAKEGVSISPPTVRRSPVASPLQDGAYIPDWTFDNRTITLPLQMIAASTEAIAEILHRLTRELVRDNNFLRMQFGEEPMFFRTFAAPDFVWQMRRLQVPGSVATLEIPAEPFVYGPKRILPTVRIYCDPNETLDLNKNTDFEVDTSDWTTTGCTFVRSNTKQKYAFFSALMTPDGVTATVQAECGKVPATPGQVLRGSTWVNTTVTRTVTITIAWYNAAGTFLSESVLANPSVTLNTWTYLMGEATAPANTASAALRLQETGTPAAGHTAYFDGARIRLSGRGPGGLCFDVTGVAGDVETPLFTKFVPNQMGSTIPPGRATVLATRRRGNPDLMPFVLQAEAGTARTDTAVGAAYDPVFSGTGANYMRTTFATDATLKSRISFAPGLTGSNDPEVRGTYRVFILCRKSVAGDVITGQVVLNPYNGSSIPLADPVILPGNIGPRLVDMGLVQFPITMDPVTDGYSGLEINVSGVAFFDFYAQRVSGSGNLDVDYLLFVPADDRFAIVSWPHGVSGASSRYVLDGRLNAPFSISAVGALVNEIPMSSIGRAPMISPGVQNRIVALRDISAGGTFTNSDTSADYFDIDPYYWPRYLMMPAGGL